MTAPMMLTAMNQYCGPSLAGSVGSSPAATSRAGGWWWIAATTKHSVIRPSSDVLFSMVLNVERQRNSQISTATGSAKSGSGRPVTKCSAKQTPPISAASTRVCTIVSTMNGTSQKAKPKCSRSVSGRAFFVVAAKRPDISTSKMTMIVASTIDQMSWKRNAAPAWEQVAMLPTSKKPPTGVRMRSEEHTSELQSRQYLVCRLLLEKKNTTTQRT